MSSAIELYKEAYDLDFNKGDSLYAETLYKELIERYPHSDEKEYAQVHLERITGVHVLVVAALPAKGLAAGLSGEPGRVDVPAGEELAMLVGKILADNADQPRPREEAGGIGKVRGRPAQRLVHAATGRFNGIKGHGTDNDQRICHQDSSRGH